MDNLKDPKFWVGREVTTTVDTFQVSTSDSYSELGLNSEDDLIDLFSQLHQGVKAKIIGVFVLGKTPQDSCYVFQFSNEIQFTSYFYQIPQEMLEVSLTQITRY